MRTQPAAEEDRSVAVTPDLRPRMKWRVAEVAAEPGYRLRVRFVDGLEGRVDMAALIRSERAGVFGALADQALFARVFVQHGAVTWPGELDLAPDAMYRAIKAQGEWVLT